MKLPLLTTLNVFKDFCIKTDWNRQNVVKNPKGYTLF